MKGKNVYLKGLSFWVFLSLFLIAFGTDAHAATITGHVYKDDGTTAIANVEVVAFEDTGSDCGAWYAATTTGGDGSYSITVADSQNYRISADASFTSCQAYVDEYYSTTNEGTNQCNEADSVAAGSTGINFTLKDGYIVSGTVTATNGGAAIANVQVTFFTGSACNGTWVGGRSTDGSGNYCFTVPAGTYYIHADASFNGSQPYVNEWYDGSTGATDCTGAVGKLVSSAETVNFALDDKITITGNITDGTNPLNDIAVFLVSGDPCNNDFELITYARTNASGDYSVDVTDVPNGNYYLVTGNWSGYINEWWDNTSDPCSATAINLIGSNIIDKNFTLDLDTTPTLSGTVKNFNGSAPITSADAPVMFVGLISGDPCSGWWQIAGLALVHPVTGEYMFTNVSPGDYYLKTNNMKQSNYVDEWWASGGSVWFKDCQNPNAETVHMTDSGDNISNKDFQLDMGVTVSGTVKNSGGSAITNAEIKVVVIMGTPCEWAWGVKSDLTDISNGTYSLWGMPPGGYYLQTRNMNQSDYVNEWWVDTIPNYSSYLCADALQLSVGGSDIPGIQFWLDAGGSVSGTISDSGGPITWTGIQVSAFIGDICGEEGPSWIGGTQTDTADGTYQIRGLPAAENVYLKTQTDQYANKWWKSTEDGTYSCASAEATNVTSGVNTPNRNFLLETGGSLTGVVKNEVGAPLQGIEVEYSNNDLQEWKQALTDSGGNFTFSHLAPGMFELSIQPEVNTGFVWYERYDCLGQNENKNMGTITLQNGAKIYGYIKNNANAAMPNLELMYGAKFEIGNVTTDSNGYFEFRLPLGTYYLDGDEDDYSMLSVEIEVTDVGTPQNLGDRTVYSEGAGAEQISGTVTDGGLDHTGMFEIVAFPDNQPITHDNFGGMCGLSFAEPEGGSYSMFVVPDEVHASTVNVSLCLFMEDENGQETMTIVHTITGITTPNTANLTYSSEGHTVSGFVKDGEGGIVDSYVYLYKQPDDIFAGFAETACDGSYTFYNVQAATYRIAATAQDYPDDTEWSSNFDLSANFTVPDINMRKTMAMPWVYLLLLFD